MSGCATSTSAWHNIKGEQSQPMFCCTWLAAVSNVPTMAFTLTLSSFPMTAG